MLVVIVFFLKNQPPQQRTFQPIATVKPMEPDSSVWGLNYPNEYSSLLQTAANALEDFDRGHVARVGQRIAREEWA